MLLALYAVDQYELLLCWYGCEIGMLQQTQVLRSTCNYTVPSIIGVAPELEMV